MAYILTWCSFEKLNFAKNFQFLSTLLKNKIDESKLLNAFQWIKKHKQKFDFLCRLSVLKSNYWRVVSNKLFNMPRIKDYE